MFFESWKVVGSCCSNFLSICLFIFYEIKSSSNLCIQWIMFIKFILSNWYLYHYYSFPGEHFDTGWSDLMEMDETPQRQSGLHRKHGPHHERLFLFVWRVNRQSCPHQTSEINVKHYYLKTDGPSGLLQDFIVWCKRVKLTDESQRQMTMTI